MNKSTLYYIIIFLVLVLGSFMFDDPTFEPYKKQFEKDTGTTISKFITVNFSTREGNIAGSCRAFPYIINIDPSVWFRVSAIQKQALIYHELSHCVCFRGHTTGYLKDGCPKSLMDTRMMRTSCLEKHWEKYMAEFCLDKR